MVRAAAILEGDVVVNITMASDEVITENGWVVSDTAKIGDTWNGIVFETPAPLVVVPQSVTMRQARLALLAQGLLSNVDTVINALPEPDKSAAAIEWEYSQTVERNRPFVLTLGAALGLDSAGLDSLFTLAATL